MSDQDDKLYWFLFSIQGRGKTPEEAWERAVEFFVQDPGDPPEPRITEDEMVRAIEGHAVMSEE